MIKGIIHIKQGDHWVELKGATYIKFNDTTSTYDLTIDVEYINNKAIQELFQMDFNTYTQHVLRTANKGLNNKELFSMAVMGMCGELGELYELVHNYTGANVIRGGLIEKEAGDFIWYFALLTHVSNCVDVTEYSLMFNDVDAKESLQQMTLDVLTLTDIVKKHVFHSKDIDFSLGSDWHRMLYVIILRFKSLIAQYNISLSSVMQTNVNKLIERYPEGFSAERANNRAEGDV